MQRFYHDAACDCARCQKAQACTTKVFGAGAHAIIFDVTSTSGKIYRVVVNKSTEIVTCNCPAGVHNYRATCSHAQRAWLEYMKPDKPTALGREYLPLSQRTEEKIITDDFPTAEEIFG